MKGEVGTLKVFNAGAWYGRRIHGQRIQRQRSEWTVQIARDDGTWLTYPSGKTANASWHTHVAHALSRIGVHTTVRLDDNGPAFRVGEVEGRERHLQLLGVPGVSPERRFLVGYELTMDDRALIRRTLTGPMSAETIIRYMNAERQSVVNQAVIRLRKSLTPTVGIDNGY